MHCWPDLQAVVPWAETQIAAAYSFLPSMWGVKRHSCHGGILYPGRVSLALKGARLFLTANPRTRTARSQRRSHHPGGERRYTDREGGLAAATSHSGPSQSCSGHIPPLTHTAVSHWGSGGDFRSWGCPQATGSHPCMPPFGFDSRHKQDQRAWLHSLTGPWFPPSAQSCSHCSLPPLQVKVQACPLTWPCLSLGA